jgi:hypothetical protein
MPCYTRFNGNRYAISTDPSGERATPGIVTIKTYRKILTDYLGYPEAKSLDPDGRPCSRYTRGLLRRRPLSRAPLRISAKNPTRSNTSRLR